MSKAEFERAEKLSASGRIFRSIALEMIEVTAMDLARKPPEYTDTSRGAHEARLTRETARRWVAGEYDATAPMPFGMCCDALGVEEEVVRRALNADPKGLLDRLKTMVERDRGSSSMADQVSQEQQNCDREISTAVRLCRSAIGSDKEHAYAELEKLSERHMMISLPGDWNGNLQLQACIERNGSVVPAASDNERGVFFGVYAQQEDGTHQWLIDFRNRRDAQTMVDRLKHIAAQATESVPTFGWKAPEPVSRPRFR